MEITAIPIPALNEIELFDIAILSHGFEKNNRDYFFIIESGTVKNQGRFKIQFTHCFDLAYRHKYASKEDSDLLKRSWDDVLLLAEDPEIEGAYWWGQSFTVSYPGFSYEPASLKAKELSELTGHTMYAVCLETEHYIMDFIFHDFKYFFLKSDDSL